MIEIYTCTPCFDAIKHYKISLSVRSIDNGTLNNKTTAFPSSFSTIPLQTRIMSDEENDLALEIPVHVRVNQNGGFYRPGISYSVEIKLKVASIIRRHQKECYPDPIVIKAVAVEAGVSRAFVYSILNELEENTIVDPSTKSKTSGKVVCGMLDYEHELFLLALRAKKPARSKADYVKQLWLSYGIKVSESSISNFFLRRFDNKGNFKKPNLVPLDKFKLENRIRYFEFMDIVSKLRDHTRWKFFDEKHLANKDTLVDKVRANPLTEQVDCIPVSGDFRETYNLIAAITVRTDCGNPMVYTMGQFNGTAESFMHFIKLLIARDWLMHNDVVCLDNARIHTGGDLSHLEQLLWNFEVQGRPLRIFVVWLPTRSPELNPIEFVFHILASRIKRYRCDLSAGPVDNEVLKYARLVMDNMQADVIAQCYIHCGY